MTGWNATLVTPDGEEIEPSTKLAGTHGPVREQPSKASDIHAAKLEKSLTKTGSTGESFQCPDCGREHNDREAEADCLRSHVRERADKLQRWANDGHDDLPGVGA
ncbi:hypothetical protein [Halosolutus halophilus]|uniref:hypothetical protein n=1 Tax=Halosolutus halophilus TaxID=1552990 RepID=UPI0022350EB1|nr:hypothetical protein [Halosolutus halophilus]